MSSKHPDHPRARRARLWLAAALCALGLSLAAPSRAEAGGLLLVTYGDSFKFVAKVPAAQQAAIRQSTGQDPDIGYKYSYFGLFWVDLWTWGGEHCLYKDKTYWKLEPAQAAALLGVDEAALEKPLTYRYPPGLMIVLLLVALLVYAYIDGTLNERKASALLQDPRYARALEILRDTQAPEGTDWPEARRQAVAAAVAYLVSQGVAEAEADKGAKLLELVHGPKQPAAQAAPPAPPPASPTEPGLPGPAAPTAP